MKNELARDLSLAKGKIQYDNSVKRVLANKRILAWILKYVTEEFSDLSVDEIKSCIGPDIEVSEVGVMPGVTNWREREKIRGEVQEDAVRVRVRFTMTSGFLLISKPGRNGSGC
ncbi:hypothetical protein [uncultured Merdimonas sp.]|uniref:hypothetical protein n=1 Tax=uncultured Merdimonas sp. TaxID=2023269 RepID=UPI003207EE04